jgi:hypothetical protein
LNKRKMCVKEKCNWYPRDINIVHSTSVLFSLGFLYLCLGLVPFGERTNVEPEFAKNWPETLLVHVVWNCCFCWSLTMGGLLNFTFYPVFHSVLCSALFWGEQLSDFCLLTKHGLKTLLCYEITAVLCILL